MGRSRRRAGGGVSGERAAVAAPGAPARAVDMNACKHACMFTCVTREKEFYTTVALSDTRPLGRLFSFFLSLHRFNTGTKRSTADGNPLGAVEETGPPGRPLFPPPLESALNRSLVALHPPSTPCRAAGLPPPAIAGPPPAATPPPPPRAARAAAASARSSASNRSLRVTAMGPWRIHDKSRARPIQGFLEYGALPLRSSE